MIKKIILEIRLKKKNEASVYRTFKRFAFCSAKEEFVVKDNFQLKIQISGCLLSEKDFTLDINH